MPSTQMNIAKKNSKVYFAVRVTVANDFMTNYQATTSNFQFRKQVLTHPVHKDTNYKSNE